MFKESFKYYKAKWPEPDLSNVIDLPANKANKVLEVRLPLVGEEIASEWPLFACSMNPLSEWRLFIFEDLPGLQLLSNVFNSIGQRYWMARSLRDYSKCPPYRSNLQNNSIPTTNEDLMENWWSLLQDCQSSSPARYKQLKKSMRWSTLGYHHNWDSKVYNYNDRSEFPADLHKMCQFVGQCVGHFGFKAEAAIVNYYPLGTTLAGHVDKSERNLDAPLFSISFGQNAIFLIGGRTLDVKPLAIMLKSGDILIMSKESRLCYHAVPRVLSRWKNDFEEDPWSFGKDSTSLFSVLNDFSGNLREFKGKYCFESSICREIINEKQWSAYQRYIDDSRININVRQVM